MTRTLRYENARWPLIRILSADTFGADGSGPWTEVTYWQANATGADVGVYLESCSRQVLPGIGDAEITMQYGRIDGVDVAPVSLLGKHIRIQAAELPDDETQDPMWRTIWLGRCRWQDDQMDAAASSPRGTRTYRCADLLYSYLSEYPMDRHAHYALSGLAAGHPGYNYDKRYPGLAMGNRDASNGTIPGPDSTLIKTFGLDDAPNGKLRTTWTEAESVENIMSLGRSAGDPIFDLDDPCGLLSAVTPIPVQDTSKAWAILTKVLDRRRGKGLAFLDWEDDSATPTGAIDVKLRVRPQLYNNIVYKYAGVDQTIVGGGSAAEYFTALDLEGDQTVESFSSHDTEDASVDELCTEGEQIEVAVTASGSDTTLVPRWSSASETAFLAADIDIKSQDVYRPVFQRFGLSRVPDLQFRNGDGAGHQQIDWWTNGDGAIYYPSPSATAPDSIEIMDDIPLYEGYDYSGADPVPSSGGVPDGLPERRKPLVMMRVASGRFLRANQYIDGGAQVSIGPDAIWVEFSGEPWERNCRDVISGVDENSVTITMGLRLPQRVRLYSAVSGTARRRLVLRIPDCHLWIGHAGAIWDLDGTDVTDQGAAPKRIGGTFYSVESATTAGKILRDDRAKLARIHWLAWEWYRSDSTRKSADWTVRRCGLLRSWKDLSGSDILNPKLGQIVTTIRASGADQSMYTPISRIDYNNRECITRCQTDWVEFDHGTA